MLEIGRTLAERGHTIEFATFDGQENWIKPEEYGFVTKIHFLGPGPTEEQLDGHYRRMQAWDISKGLGNALGSKYLWDSFWPQTYHHLKDIMNNPENRPSLMVADFFVEAVNDIHVEYNLPITVVCPNMPSFQLPCSYIPGQPGFQLPGTMTSEHASMCLRIKNEIVLLPDLPAIFKMMRWTKRLRNENGVYHPPHRPQKPDYLIFVNSFFGLEIPRDLPPTCAPVGPLLSPSYPPLDEACESFLSKHRSVLYIALGTHIILPHNDAVKIVDGVLRLMEEQLIDGVIWAIGKSSRQDIDQSKTFDIKTAKETNTVSLGDLLDNRHPDWLFSFFAPQRAILDHESTKLYFTHGGGSSANEALFHGKPMVSMGIFGDQIENTTRLVAGGVAESLSKFNFTSDELYTKAKKIVQSADGGLYQRNVLRLKRIAHVAARRRFYAADLVEELVYDNELRFTDDGKELRPMHLQTADMRMPAYKAKNWDLYAVSSLGLSAAVGSTWLVGHFLWFYKAHLMDRAQLVVSSCWQLLNVALGK